MNPDFHPLLAVPATPHGSGIRFAHPKEQYDIDEFADVIWAILAECNGHNEGATIAARVQKRFQEVPVETITGIIADLGSLGVLVDSREAYQPFHLLTANPLVFTRHDSSPAPLWPGRPGFRGFNSEKLLSSEEIGRVTASIETLRPLRIFAILTHKTDLAAGYYECEPSTGRLAPLQSEVDTELLQYAFNSDTLLSGAPVIVVIAADLHGYSRRHSNRGYRHALVDAGKAAQRMHLAAADIGATSLESDDYLDEVLAAELGLEAEQLVPLLAVAFGHEAAQPAFDSAALLTGLQTRLVGRSKPVRSAGITSGTRPWEGDTFFAAAADFAATPQTVWRSYRQRAAGGTATSANLAQAIAIIEAYERYVSGLVRTDVSAKAADLTERWLDPRRAVPFTAGQYARWPSLQPFAPDKPWQWVRGFDVVSGTSVLVPGELAFYPLGDKTYERPLCYKANSSGVAAFTNERDAIKRGLIELVERDAIMRNWFARRPPARIGAKNLPYHLRRRYEYWQERGRQTHVLDLSGHGIVAVVVAIVSHSEYPRFVAGAAASDESFEVAAAKAFHEAEYGLLQALSSPKTRKIKPEQVAGPADHGRLYDHPEHFQNLEWLWSGPLTSSTPRVSATYEELLQKFKPVAVRLSPLGSPLSVVRVLSQKLVPINFGFGTEHFSHAVVREKINPDNIKLPHYFA